MHALTRLPFPYSQDPYTTLRRQVMKLAEKIASYKGDRPFFTLEFFPPKTDQVCFRLMEDLRSVLTLDRVSRTCCLVSHDWRLLDLLQFL